MDELHESYGGICAYLCVYIERCTGGVSTDHFVAKSKTAGLAYEWSNYRLACATMNARKRDFEDVLDPFALEPDTFRLELVTGHIYPNPHLSSPALARAQQTIDRLDLDDDGCRELRSRKFRDYVRVRGSEANPMLEQQFRRDTPFVWLEASRQGLL
ncbi:MAG: hypothetical protein KDK70_05845 [Myxococcales bacterium]|nr:hypothetical protein [Myxococcales bacterium]